MRNLIVMCICIFSGLSVFGQKYSPGPQVVSFHSMVDGTDQPYGLYIPANFDEKKSYPLVVMLHGAGSNHRLALRRVFGKSNAEGETDVEASLYFPEFKNVDYIVVSTLARGTMGYQGVAEKDVWGMVADVKKRFKIDENRTYLTGLSMGGGGTLWIGLTRPDFWAAIAPVCPAPPEGTEKYVANAAMLPTHFFQGEIDPVVSTASVNKWVDEFKKTGTHTEYVVYPGVQHDSWVNAYADNNIFKWFENYKRDPNPKKVVFSTAQLKYNKSYWVEILGITSGETAAITAEIGKNSEITIKAENVEAFRLHENQNIKLGERVNVIVNGQKLEVKKFSGKEVFAFSNGKVSLVSDINFLKREKQAGPMSEAVADRHVYVYGTLDNPSKEELERRRKVAETAADWSYYRGEFLGRVMVFPRVLSDKEVRESDYVSSNLILFGTEKDNSVIAKYGDRLPFSFKGSLEQSLTYVFPNEKKLILINSGFPFWELKDKGNPFLRILRNPSKAAILDGYGDWVYGDKENVISGFFDNRWKLKEADKQKMAKQPALVVK